MIRNEKEYTKAMKKMILRVQNDGAPKDAESTIEEMEVLTDCIRAGYLIGTTTFTDSSTGAEIDLRTMDGKMHPELLNNSVTPKGLAFLKPNKANLKSNVAIVTSILATLISLLAFLVTLLSDLDSITSNWELFKSLFG